MSALRTLPILAVAAVVLTVGGCRTSSTSNCRTCRPPAALVEQPTHEVPRYVPPPRATAVAPMPPPAPAPSGDDQFRLDTLQTTIERQREQLELQRREMARLDGEQKAKAMALDQATKSRVDSEQAAQKLADEMKGVPGATVLVEGSKVCVIVTDCFESGSERLKPSPDVRAAIRATAAAILRHPEAQVAVVGHTDSKPIQKKLDKWPTNVELSKARAEQVATAISTDGVEKTRMQVDGKGAAEMLVVPEKTAADRARNRRVEVQFHFNS
jgi:flagellar motor protein MotB